MRPLKYKVDSVAEDDGPNDDDDESTVTLDEVKLNDSKDDKTPISSSVDIHLCQYL